MRRRMAFLIGVQALAVIGAMAALAIIGPAAGLNAQSSPNRVGQDRGLMQGTPTSTATRATPTATATRVVPTSHMLYLPHLARAIVPLACEVRWTRLYSPNGEGAVNQVNDLAAIAANDVWAVGASGHETLISHWDGRRWARVASPSPAVYDNTLEGVAAIAANDVWAVGSTHTQTLALHWNGQMWAQTPTPSRGTVGSYLHGVSVAPGENGDVWAVGHFISDTLRAEALVLRRRAGEWTRTDVPDVGAHETLLYGVAAATVNDVWAVGRYADVPGETRALTMRWDGAGWRVVTNAAPATVSQLMAVTALGANDVWAVGYTAGPTLAPLILHWDGQRWTQTPIAKVGFLFDVAARGPNDVWAVGGTVDGRDFQPLTLHWNGSRWTVVASPWVDSEGTFNRLLAVAPIPGSEDDEVWAAGAAGVFREASRTLIQHYRDPGCS